MGAGSERFEHVDDVVGDAPVLAPGAAYLISAELEWHREPMPALVREPDLEWLHDVLLRYPLWPWAFELSDGAGERAPAGGETVAELGQIVVEAQAGGSGHVEVGREAAAGLADAQLHGRPALDDTRRQHLADDGVRHGPLYSPHRPAFLASQIVDSCGEGPKIRRPVVAFSGHATDSSSARIRPASLLRSSPRRAAFWPASTSRSRITSPRQSSSARATVAEGMPS